MAERYSGRPPMRLAGSMLDEHRHACAFFDSPEDEMTLLLPFFRAGLARGQRAVYITPRENRESIDALVAGQTDLSDARRREQLLVLESEDTYMPDGRFDGDRMIGTVEQLLSAGRPLGFGLTRLIAHAEPVLTTPEGARAFIMYESRLNETLARYSDAVICTYDLSKTGPRVIVDVLRTHPMAIIGGVLHENPYYTQPADFLAEATAGEQPFGMYDDSRRRPRLPRTQKAPNTRRIRAYVRDVVALTGMPAWWIGRPPALVAQSTHEMLSTMLRHANIHVELHDGETGQKHAVGAGIPFSGRLRMATFAVGVQGEFGRLVATSERPDFPDELDAILLRVAANEIAVSFQHASLLHRHQEAEARLARLAEEQGVARAKAEQASKVKTDFLGIMSHELRTPLNAIGGYVQLLEAGIRGPITVPQRDDLGRIGRAQRHLLGVISNVLGFLRLNEGKLPYAIRTVAVDHLLATVEDLTRPLFDAKQLHYERRCPENGLLVRADEEKLQQVLVNLLGNASKFTDSGGAVALEVATDGSTVRIAVRDSGRGIPPDKLAAAFEPFTQLDTGHTRGAGGSGLGLTISRDFTSGMGGRLLAESEPGQGSLFTVELPREREKSVER